ncbi:flagellar motor switch protein FliG [Fodinibius sediminis]|uniref:Flagellar motor switch protein FliG n=1 Tax=Fodinibius sediminis TaxID=1214077 RepID=A0A521CJ84_9BACT|nr:flagellar motor switch protein FliG [Fodinibius sediminis]SMO59445.1 flagellar motor switch protein FliG [Fodinibius sediminis]
MPKQEQLIDDVSDLNGTQKVAVLLISLGVEKASSILKELRDDEVEAITLEIATMSNISPDVVEAVIQEFHGLIRSERYVLEGGMDYARNVLKEAKEEDEVQGIMKRLESKTGTDTFGLFQSAETSHIVQFLQDEHPQIAAVILAHLNVRRAGEILGELPPGYQTEISMRMATMGNISSEVIEEIEKVIRDQMGTTLTQSANLRRGTLAVANILNEVDISTERSVIGNIEKMDEELAHDIKSQMFLFEDIIELADRYVQIIIANIDRNDLVMGLKGVEDELVQKFMDNMSSRAKQMLIEDIEAAGQVHRNQVEEAQQRIVSKIKELEEEGQVSTRKSNAEEFIE